MADSRNQCLVCARSTARRRPFLGRTALALASVSLLAACAERYEIGQLGYEPQPQQSPSGASAFVDTLLASDVDDGDVVLDQELAFRSAVGDVDGDGYDDWITADGKLIYGGPRAQNGLLRVPADAPQFSWLGQWGAAMPAVAAAGDVDGDGFGDLLFSGSVDSTDWWDLADLDQALARCSGQHAYLWYGRAERPRGSQDLSVTAVPFDYSEDVAIRLQQELSGLRSHTTAYSARCELELAPEGDLDGDGFADFSLTSRFDYQVSNEDPADRYSSNAPSPAPIIIYGAQGSAFILYGRSTHIASAADALRSGAKLEGAQSLLALGDVDGDGHDDLLVTPSTPADGSPELRLVPGGEERLQGELNVATSGVPLTGFGPNQWQGIAVGDLDDDGFRDFLIQAYDPASSNPSAPGDMLYYIFYGGSERAGAPVHAEQADAVIRIPGALGFVRAAGDWQGDGFDDLSLALSIRPGTEERFRALGDLSPDEYELELRSFEAEANELHLLSGGHARMSGSYAPAVFRPDLAPPIPESTTAPVLRLYPGGPIGDFDGDGRADLTFMVSPVGAEQSSSMIKYGGPLPSSARPLH